MVDADQDLRFQTLTCENMEYNTVVAATAKVFNTAELLQEILLCLPAKDIISSMRTSRQFRDVVYSSIRIKKGIFLIHNEKHYASDFPDVNPFLQSTLQKLSFTLKPISFKEGRKVTLQLSLDRPSEAHYRGLQDLIDTANQDGWWRNLKLTSLPVTTKIRVLNDGESTSATQYTAFYTLEGKDITLGTLFDIALYARHLPLKHLHSSRPELLPDDIRQATATAIVLTKPKTGRKCRPLEYRFVVGKAASRWPWDHPNYRY